MTAQDEMKELLDRLANAKHLRDTKAIDDGDLLGFAEETVDEYLEMVAGRKRGMSEVPVRPKAASVIYSERTGEVRVMMDGTEAAIYMDYLEEKLATASEMYGALKLLSAFAKRQGWIHVAINAADAAIEKAEGNDKRGSTHESSCRDN